MRCWITLLAGLTLHQGPAAAEKYPVKPVKVIIPYAAGGMGDSVARLVGRQVSEELGQQFVIENRPGGRATIGTAAIAQAEPDGYVIGMVQTSHVVTPYVQKRLPYDTVKDFAPITTVSRMPGLLAVHPSVPARTVQELVAHVRQNPGKVFYAVPGALTNGHVTMEMFKLSTGIDLTPVVYAGGGPASIDVLAGNVQVIISAPAALMEFVREGKLVPLATTGATRPSGLDQVPTLRELGYSDIETYEWIGALAPAGTPPAIVELLSGAIARAVQKPDVAKSIAAFGGEPVARGPAELSGRIAAGMAAMEQLTAKVKLAD